MNLSYYRNVSAKTSGISFPGLECWNPITQVATMAAEVNAERVACRLTLATLQQKFGATAERPLLAIKENRATIEGIARRLIEEEAFQDDGSIVISEKDI